MFDTVVAWINPPALVREVLIAMLMAAVARFLYWRIEKHWERLTGYVSNRTKKSRARRDRLVRFYEENSHLLPLHLARVAYYQFAVLFLLIITIFLSFVDHFVGTGQKVMKPDQIASAHFWLGIYILIMGCGGMIAIILMMQAQSISAAIERRARHREARPPEEATPD